MLLMISLLFWWLKLYFRQTVWLLTAVEDKQTTPIMSRYFLAGMVIIKPVYLIWDTHLKIIHHQLVNQADLRWETGPELSVRTQDPGSVAERLLSHGEDSPFD